MCLRSLFVYISEIFFAVLSYLSFCCDFSEILCYCNAIALMLYSYTILYHTITTIYLY